MNNTYNELDDFLDVEKVDSWKPASKKDTVMSFILLVLFVAFAGLALLAFHVV